MLVFCATLLAYLPSIHGGRLWDDEAHITISELQTWPGLWRIWFQLGATQQYYPALHSAFWLEHRLWGDAVLGYHLINLGLHATAACLFAWFLGRIRLEAPGPGWLPGTEWLAAAVFALHPVCVESVAWISEQKNTLSLVFYLLAALAYLRFDRGRRWSWYALALGLFILALLSKSVTATLPAALLLVQFWRRGRLSWRRDIVPLLPWFVIGAGTGLFTAWVEQKYIGARGQAYDLDLIQRCFLAGRVVWFYLGKLAWPVDLTFIYPRWQVGAGWPWSLGCLALVATVGALWKLARWNRAPLIALLFFVGSLFPVLGFFNVFPFIYSYVADHWQYLPCLGMIALATESAAALAQRLIQRSSGMRRIAVGSAFALAAVAGLAVLFVLTRRQCGLYRDVETLYADTLVKNPACWMARNNLGMVLSDLPGRRQDAIAEFEAALHLKRDYEEAHNNLGAALAQMPGRLNDAIAEFEEALRLRPDYAKAHNNLGAALAQKPGRLNDAIAEFEAALRLNPDYADAHNNLGLTLARIPGRLENAVAEYKEALRLNPGYANAHNNLGLALSRMPGRLNEAITQYNEALGLQPDYAEAHRNLGDAWSQTPGRLEDAIAQYKEVLRLQPDLAEAHNNLGVALSHMSGRLKEAVAEYEAALRLNPDFAEAHANLGLAWSRMPGRLNNAVAEYKEALRLRPDYAPGWHNLGVNCFQLGDLPAAAAAFREELRLHPDDPAARQALATVLQQSGAH